MVWGKNDNEYRFRFGISGNGQYRIDSYNGSWTNLKEWTISDLVNKSDYNKLTVRKIRAQYYFFLNEQLVHTSDFSSFFGNQIGFQDNQNTTMRANYVKVSYLKPNSNSNLSDTESERQIPIIKFPDLADLLVWVISTRSVKSGTYGEMDLI